MEVPEPPNDPEQRNIIEKLADFVARNGPEFELYTKDKQRDNPKFAFLQGGEFYDYYKFKVDELRKRWQTQRPPKDNYSQREHFGYQWGEGRSGPWEQYPNAGGGGDFGQAYPLPNSCGWGGEQDNQWYPPPSWAGGPGFPGGPGLPNVGSPYGPPPPGMNMGDGYRGRGYNMPPFGYNGPPNQGPPYQPHPEFGYSGENFDYPPTADGVPNATPEFGESDIEQSEKNLEAQHEVLMTRQAVEIEELLDRAMVDTVKEKGSQLGLSWEQMNEVVQPIIESCTKENISKGKAWVIERGSASAEPAELMADYLLARAAVRDASFDTRLHLVYLLNDLLHHFKRRGAPNHLQTALHRIVPIVFCLTSDLANEEQKTKLNRVLDLWDSNAYLSPEVLGQMRPQNMEAFMTSWKESRKQANEAAIEKIKKAIEAEYTSLEQQHKEFAEHVRQQLASSQADSDQMKYDNRPPPAVGDPGYDRWGPIHMYEGVGGDGPTPRGPHPGDYFMPPHMPHGGPGYHGWPGGHRGPPPNWVGPPPFPGPPYPPRDFGPPSVNRMDAYPYMGGEENEPDYDRYGDRGYNSQFDNYYRYEGRNRGDSRDDRSHHHHRAGRPSRFSSVSSRHESSRDEPLDHRHRSRGPYGKAEQMDEKSRSETPPADEPKEPLDLEPKCPPWELPAALMHSLIRLCDFDFTPLDSSKLRLLPPKPPTERLMVAIENFYLPPSHDRTRDGEGWERLGLYEFYSKKEKAREYVERMKQSNSDNASEYSTNDRRRRNRKQSGGSGVGSPSGDETEVASVSQRNAECEHMKPFVRDSGGLRPTAPHLAHITAYPTAAIGQGIRTGLEALTSAPPPIPGGYPGFKPVAPVGGPGGGIAIPPPGIPGAPPPGIPVPGFLQFPPPNMAQPPPSNLPPALIQRSTSGPGYSASRSRLDSRRSRSPSKSRSRSRSRSDRSDRSASKSRSRSPRTRSGSRSRSRSRSRSSPSRSPRDDTAAGSGAESNDARTSRSRRRRKSSRSRSASSSPRARFTSAPGPGGIGPNAASISAARAAAMAVAASITSSLNAAKSNAAPGANGRATSSESGGRSSGPPPGPQHPPARTRTRFSSAAPNPNRVAEMHLLGQNPDERLPPAQ